MHLNLIHRGSALTVSGDDPVTLGDLRIQVCAALSVPKENVRLLTDGNVLSPAEDHTPLPQLLRPSQPILVLATKPEIVANVKEAKPDTALRPFDAREPKYVAAPRKTPQRSSKYCFRSVSVLPNLPNSDRARQILEQLASDRGFLSVMEKKRWNVGELSEMQPEGRVGVDPVCVLGYNTNKGQTIHLRLRTDDMKGFRAMSSIRQVLAHELAHNEFSEHDDNFKELMRWIEKTADRDNWRSRGHRLDSGWNAPDFGTGPSSLTSPARTSDEYKLGTERDSTGVSRLLQAYETKAENAVSGCAEEDSSMQVRRDANPLPDVMRDGAHGFDSPRNEERNDTDASNSRGSNCEKLEPERTVGSVEGSEAISPLGQVMSLGFSQRLAALALRENGGNGSRAADWLLSASWRRQTHGEVGEAEAELSERVQIAVNSLGTYLDCDELILVLEALHMYMSNILRYPSAEGYRRINSQNKGFQRRVGAFADAIEVVRAAGFRLDKGFWKYNSLEVSRVWIAKSVVEERLLEELMKVKSNDCLI